MNNIRITKTKTLLSPKHIINDIPNTCEDFITECRQTVANIINRTDNRLLLVVGPCSIHDVNSAIEYGRLLRGMMDVVKERIFCVMRVYFEKPRTTIGWKGHINDPNMDGTYDINLGLKSARNLLLTLNKMGVPCGCEFLDTISPQYVSDLVTWGAIGARTTESQLHRQMVSGLSMPVGFKNGTGGNVNIAIAGMQCASTPHCFLGVNENGEGAIFHTAGNPDTHVILRGGKEPNYFYRDIVQIEHSLIEAKQKNAIIIDCSHANSKKDYNRQKGIVNYLIRSETIRHVVGIMLESNINEGNQSIPPTEYGVSVTDACLGWEDTKKIIKHLYDSL